MEGKKYRAFEENCQAVSEVIGQALMISVVVIAFSTIALTVFSDGGAVKPPHTPYTSLREKISTTTNCVYITHSGGEAIDLSAIKIILIFPTGQKEFSKLEDFDEDKSIGLNDNVFTLGDCIVINDKNITSGNDIDMFFVHTPSKQVIQRAVLSKE